MGNNLKKFLMKIKIKTISIKFFNERFFSKAKDFSQLFKIILPKILILFLKFIKDKNNKKTKNKLLAIKA